MKHADVTRSVRLKANISSYDSLLVSANLASPSGKPHRSATVLVRLVHPAATMPRRGTGQAAGLDLFPTEDGVIPKDGSVYRIGVGIQMAIPPGTYGQIATRSSMARHNLSVEGGS